MFGCLLGAKFLEVAVYSKLNTSTINNKSCREAIFDSREESCGSLRKKNDSFECRGDNDYKDKSINFENSDGEIKKKKDECNMKRFPRDNEKLNHENALCHFMRQNSLNSTRSLQKILDKNMQKIDLEAHSSDMSILYPHLEKLVRCSDSHCRKRHKTQYLPEGYKTSLPFSRYQTTENNSFIPKSYYGNCCHYRNSKAQKSHNETGAKCSKDSSDTQSRESFGSVHCSAVQKEESEENEKKPLDFYLKKIKGRLSSAEMWVNQAKQEIKNNLQETLIDYETLLQE